MDGLFSLKVLVIVYNIDSGFFGCFMFLLNFHKEYNS